jgi:CheY-like chemotaxis protein
LYDFLDAFRNAHLENKVSVVRTGEEALDYLFGKGPYTDGNKYPVPDMILLDLKLPGIDGFGVLRKVKNTPILKRIPIIVLTSSTDEGDRALSYDNGVNSYLIKPVSFGDFLEMVTKIEDYWISLNVGPPKE